jgi:hypothetical protein
MLTRGTRSLILGRRERMARRSRQRIGRTWLAIGGSDRGMSELSYRCWFMGSMGNRRGDGRGEGRKSRGSEGNGAAWVQASKAGGCFSELFASSQVAIHLSRRSSPLGLMNSSSHIAQLAQSRYRFTPNIPDLNPIVPILSSDCDTPLSLLNITFDFLQKEWADKVDFVICLSSSSPLSFPSRTSAVSRTTILTPVLGCLFPILLDLLV